MGWRRVAADVDAAELSGAEPDVLVALAAVLILACDQGHPTGGAADATAEIDFSEWATIAGRLAACGPGGDASPDTLADHDAAAPAGAHGRQRPLRPGTGGV